MKRVNVYITFNGNCEEAFNFYRSVFGSDFLYIGRYKEVPTEERRKFRADCDEKIMHISLPISNETILMGCDNAELNGERTIVGNNISLSLDTDNREEADRLFIRLSTGADVKMLMSETFWGAYFGVLTDRFGITWLINCEIKQGMQL